LPSDWDFCDQHPYGVRVVNPQSPVCLFDAEKDGDLVYGNYWFRILPSKNPAESILNMSVRNLLRGEHRYAARFFFAGKTEGRKSDLISCSRIVLSGYSLGSEPLIIELGIVTDLGYTYAGLLTVKPESGEYSIALSDLKKTKTVILPNVYPTFLPFYFEGEDNDIPDITKAESVQISIGPGIPESEYDKPYGVAIEKIYLR
jgi:hypothetical protein